MEYIEQCVAPLRPYFEPVTEESLLKKIRENKVKKEKANDTLDTAIANKLDQGEICFFQQKLDHYIEMEKILYGNLYEFSEQIHEREVKQGILTRDVEKSIKQMTVRERNELLSE
jgi:hypothetical protein